jgi:hypothetical protein
MVDEVPLRAIRKGTPGGLYREPMLPADELSTISNPKRIAESQEIASTAAAQFLQSLQAEMQTVDGHKFTVGSLKETLEGSSQVVGHTPMVEDAPEEQNGSLRNPPFGDAVVQLFQGRSNPVVNSREKRKTASQMMDELESVNEGSFPWI